MTMRIPARRLVEPSATFRYLLRQCPSCNRPSLVSSLTFIRNASSKNGDETLSRPSNPVLESYLKQKPNVFKTPEPPKRTRGTVADDSIFEDDEEGMPYEEEFRVPPSQRESEAPKIERDMDNVMNALDPDPASRMKWERKMVIRQIRKRGRLTKAQKLKRTERESLAKSHLMKTSTKKLGMLARQIAGKPIEDAITQMRFSKKRVARDVKEHLEYARDRAIVSRGLGLGKVEGRAGEPVEIEMKDGSRRKVNDRTGIYIDQAWVGRGSHTKSPEFRARGRVNMLHHPHTSLSVVLKEEATRIRLSDERQQKKLNRKLWLHLPDRPISQQRQYPLW